MSNKEEIVYLAVNEEQTMRIKNNTLDKIVEICKVGKTRSEISARMSALTRDAVIGGYSVIHSVSTSDCSKLEKNVFKRLEYCQIDNTEHFNEKRSVIKEIMDEEHNKLIKHDKIMEKLFEYE